MARAETLHRAGCRPKTASGASAHSAKSYEVTLEEGWNPALAETLWSRSSTASVFNHPAWWQASIDGFGKSRRILGVTVRANGELCGYWPFWEKRMGPKDAFARVLEPVGARLTDYVMPLVAHPYDRAGVATAMLEALKARLSSDAILLWPKADRICSADAAVDGAFPGTRFLVHRNIRRCPRMTLPDSYEMLMQQWSRNHRSQLRRRMRRLEEMGDLTLHVAGSREEVLDGMGTMIPMHRVNWNNRGEGSEFDDPASCAFIEKIVSGLPLELLHYSELRLDGRPLSCNLDFLLDDEVLFYKGAFDIEYASYSPGMVHIAKVSEWAIGEKIRVLDFMQGEEPYKYLWADGVRDTVSHAVSPLEALPVWLWNAKLRKLIIEYKV